MGPIMTLKTLGSPDYPTVILRKCSWEVGDLKLPYLSFAKPTVGNFRFFILLVFFYSLSLFLPLSLCV